MLENMCVFNNKVFIPGDSSLIAFEYCKCGIKNSQKKFKESFRLKIPLPSNFSTKNILLDVVECYAIGLKCMIVLAISIFDEIAIFMYCNALRNNLFRVKNLSWPSLPNIEKNPNIFVTHGPIFVVLVQDVLQMYSLSYKTKNYLALGTVLKENKKSFGVMQCISVGQLHSKNPLSILLFVLYHEISYDSNEIKIIATSINTKNSDMPVQYKHVPISYFFLESFQKVIKLVHVSNISICEQTVSNLEEICWDNNCIFACTYASELLVFLNRTLKYVYNHPLPDILYMRSEFCNVTEDAIHLLIVDKCENVHLLNKTEDSNVLQLRKSWKKIVCVLSGDFMLNSSKWLLLLRKCDPDTWQDDCILSDASSVIPMDVIGQNMIPAASVEKTIPGIQTNIQAGKLAILESEAQIAMKAEATLDAIYRIKNCRPEDENAMHHISTFQESLIDIILTEDKNLKDKDNIASSKLSLTLQNHWQRIMNHKWILCWTFINTDDKPICYPVVHILIQDQPIQCIQKIFIHKASTLSIDDECRYEIKPSEKFSLVANLDIPQFHCTVMNATTILSWWSGSSDSFVVPHEEKITFPQQMLLQTSLSVSDVFSTELKNISTWEDVACLKILQQPSVFSISTLHSHLTDFENIILSSANAATNIRLFKCITYKGLVFVEATSPLYGAHFRFKDSSEKKMETEIFSKSDKEAFLMVQYLYQCLPEDSLILPCAFTTSDKVQLMQDSVMAMKNELDLLQYSLHVYNVDEEARKQSKKTFDEGTILIPRAVFSKIRKELFRKESITDNIMRNLYDNNAEVM